MKKLFLFIMLLLPINVLAASGSIKASTSSTKVTLNNTFTVKVTCSISGSSAIGSCEYNLDYDKSKLSITSGQDNLTVRDWSRDGKGTTITYTYKFKAIKVGSTSITLKNAKVGDWDTDKYVETKVSNLDLTIKEPVIINYSSDNNLKSLSVDGFDISPEFNKSTLEYNVLVKADTTKVKINANVNDSKAKIKGTGEKEVKEGINSFEIVVTAENGTNKTYKVNIIVPEKDPIKFVYKNEEYNILRKLPEDLPLNFNTNTIKVNNEDVICMQNEKLNLTLLYLRNKNNKEGFYIYDEKNSSVKLYNEVKNNDLSIYIEGSGEKIDNLFESIVRINGEDINAYQIQKGSKDYIIYGRDVSTGKRNYYVYDKNNRTISLFNQSDYEYLLNSNNIYKILTYAFILLIFIEFIIILLTNSTKKKMNKIIHHLQDEKNNSEETSLE